MADPLVSIIMRSFNEGWALRETLPSLKAQDYTNWELIVIDSGSTDGSVDLIRGAAPRHFVQIQPHEYNPARVMNQGMELARSGFGIFLNADATPQGANWLRPLVAALQDPQVAAVFGRQIPRPDCRAVYAHDYERCFGDNRESTRWDHFFSMVSSGLRKDIWAQRGFLEQMQYSEDDEYTRWCRAQGYQIVYVPESVVMHSHNYSPAQAYKRSFGEAKALAAVWRGERGDINWGRTVCLGWINDARRDLTYCARSRRLREWPHAMRIRWEQRRAKLAGFQAGWEFYRNGRQTGPRPDGTAGAAPAPQQPNTAETSLEALEIHPRSETGRFTVDGSDRLEKRIADLCQQVLEGVRTLIPDSRLEALVLGGGYGRGEGGVLRIGGTEAPYNDLEFYVFLRGNRLLNERRYHHALHELGVRTGLGTGLEIEFKVDSLPRLRHSRISMFSYDLVSGHKVVWGEPNLFHGCDHHRDASRIPLSEATRLLFNRCTGLLLAKEFLRSGKVTAEQNDFIGRNIAKAQLALGDALLVAAGKYHWSCVERHERLQDLATRMTREEWSDFDADCLADVLLCHAAGVEFKLHPHRTSASMGSFESEHREVSRLASAIWIWLENRRLKHTFPSARDYAISRVPKCGEISVFRSVLLNARTFGVRTLLHPAAWRYPRERLLNSLPLLLWDEPLNDLRIREHLQNQLQTTASDWQSLVAAYKNIWPRFS